MKRVLALTAVLLASMTFLVVGGTVAEAQTASPCAPGGPSNPANPNNPYPPSACGLRLGKTQAAPGEAVPVSGEGCAPNSTVTVRFGSTVLTTLQSNAAGAFSTTVSVPSTAPLGRSTISVACTAVNGRPMELAADLTVVAAAGAERSRAPQAAGSNLPRTGAAIGLTALAGLALVALGAFVVAAVRRRDTASV
ncbi:MAG TPA: LPXTG cell wall anchor domain-containing protein [Acidimicrobiales bacterium]